MTTYSDLLRDPRWQKVRLKKLEGAEWKCERCMDDATTLHVHHKRYVKGRKPWEYDDGELAVLCEPCHEAEHESKQTRDELMAHLWVDGPMGIDDFVAYGSGAVGAYLWLADDSLAALLKRVEDGSPFQFAAGRFASTVSSLVINLRIEKNDAEGNQAALVMNRLSELADGDADFVADLMDLFRRHLSS